MSETTMNHENLEQAIIAAPTEADAEAIGPMHLRSWLETYQNVELGVDEAWIRENVGFVATTEGTEYRRRLFEGIESGEIDAFYRVAKNKNDEILGFCMAKREPDGSGRLDALYLTKDAQGKGLGGKLMKEAFAWLGDEAPVKLQVVDYNKNAIEFYQKYGFELTEEKEEFKPPVNVVWMVKK